jgi:hypothetical protein
VAKRQSADHKVGSCVCGRDIEIGDRYSLSTERPTTIKRVCEGYNCGRLNEIVMTVSVDVKRMSWAAHECLCGSAVYLRAEYAGYGFEGWSGTGFEAMSFSEKYYKNRTVKAPCRGCGCKYVFQIRFTMEPDTEKEGEQSRYRNLGVQVHRCRSCKARKERNDSASA